MYNFNKKIATPHHAAATAVSASRIGSAYVGNMRDSAHQNEIGKLMRRHVHVEQILSFF